MAYGYYLQAEYEDGYIHYEDDQDRSAFDARDNIYADILKRRPEAAHGQLIRFSLVGGEGSYDIDFRPLPKSSRPFYEREMFKTWDEHGNILGEGASKHRFGYIHTTEEGTEAREIVEI